MQELAMRCRNAGMQEFAMRVTSEEGDFTTYSVTLHNWLCTTYPQLESGAFFVNDLNLPFFVINTYV